jgi:PH (Pleckstrin Homology) domain-containing protein/putative oligomerization/nucleic acid binding protein
MANDIIAGGPARHQIDQLVEQKLDKGIKFMVRREIKKLPELLHEGEILSNVAQGRYEGKQGLVAVTDQRVLFVEEGVMRSRLEDFPYGRISTIQHEKSMMWGKVTIFASGNKAIIDNIAPKDQASVIADFARARIGEASAPSTQPVPTAPVADDPMEKLRKLGELREAGVLTDEEFATQKAKILDSL